MATLVINGSARKNSDTQRLVDKLLAEHPYTTIKLKEYSLSPYSYEHDYPAHDQFMEIIEQLLQYDNIVFATPVYWYAMSGLLKNFLDRFTDLLKTHKDHGRKLRGKRLFLVVVSNSPELPPGFEVPFTLSAEYLGMAYGATYFCPAYELNNQLPNTHQFLQHLS